MDFQEKLRRIMSESNQFREIQKSTIRAIMKEKSPVIAVMRIEDDKSLLFMLPVLCEPKGTSIVVISLIALRKDLKKRCEKTEIRCAK